MKRLFVVAALLAASAALAAPAFAVGKFYTLVKNVALPDGEVIQIAAFTSGARTKQVDDYACDVYVGTELYAKGEPTEEDKRRLTALADQAFEEVVGVMCAERMFKTAAGKWRHIPRLIMHVNSPILMIKGRNEFPDGAGEGFGDMPFLVEYRVKGTEAPLDNPERAGSVEFVRVTQPEIPVAQSVREPSLAATPKEIEPGVTIGLENVTDHTYYQRDDPTQFVFYQTSVPISDKAASRALAQKVAAALGGERLKEGDLHSVSVGAFNEPKRSRFHFRQSFRYDAFPPPD